MSHNLISLIAFAVLIPSIELLNTQPNNVIGKWKNSDDSSFQVEIYLAKDKYFYGKIINDTKTPPNKIVLNKFIYNSNKKKFFGTMIPPNAGIEIKAEIVFISPNKLKITAQKLFITKTMFLIRI